MSLDPFLPYGPLVESTVRIVTWNVWGRYGDDSRQSLIEEALFNAQPDVVCLVESWSTTETDQPSRIAQRLGLDHALFVGEFVQDGWISGIGLVSRWPISNYDRMPLRTESEPLWTGDALYALIDGERGPIQLAIAMCASPLDGSALRQRQVRALTTYLGEHTRRRYPTILCGDFNAGPESDEIRLLTGHSAVPEPGLVFYDSWEIAGNETDGHTWSNRNPLARLSLYPDQRFDYVFSAWPRAGGVGHPKRCELLGVVGVGEPNLSDHYGVLADLAY